MALDLPALSAKDEKDVAFGIENGIEKGVLDSVRCPIGLEIGADSPEEIAVAVCGEILSLERGINPT